MSSAKRQIFDDMDREAELTEAACAEGFHSFSSEGTCACGAVECLPDPDRPKPPPRSDL